MFSFSTCSCLCASVSDSFLLFIRQTKERRFQRKNYAIDARTWSFFNGFDCLHIGNVSKNNHIENASMKTESSETVYSHGYRITWHGFAFQFYFQHKWHWIRSLLWLISKSDFPIPWSHCTYDDYSSIKSQKIIKSFTFVNISLCTFKRKWLFVSVVVWMLPALNVRTI